MINRHVSQVLGIAGLAGVLATASLGGCGGMQSGTTSTLMGITQDEGDSYLGLYGIRARGSKLVLLAMTFKRPESSWSAEQLPLTNLYPFEVTFDADARRSPIMPINVARLGTTFGKYLTGDYEPGSAAKRPMAWVQPIRCPSYITWRNSHAYGNYRPLRSVQAVVYTLRLWGDHWEGVRDRLEKMARNGGVERWLLDAGNDDVYGISKEGAVIKVSLETGQKLPAPGISETIKNFWKHPWFRKSRLYVTSHGGYLVVLPDLFDGGPLGRVAPIVVNGYTYRPGNEVLVIKAGDTKVTSIKTHENSLPLAWVDESEKGVRCLYTNLVASDKGNLRTLKFAIARPDGEVIESASANSLAASDLPRLALWDPEARRVWWWKNGSGHPSGSCPYFKPAPSDLHVVYWDYGVHKTEDVRLSLGKSVIGDR